VAESAPARGPGARVVLAGFWLLGCLPLAWSHWLGALWGRSRRGRVRYIVERNLALCFPDLDDAARGRLVEASLAEAGRSMLEAFRIWTRPRSMLARIVRVEGGDELAAARAEGRGVLLLAPHLGAWELLNLYLATTGPGAVLYKPPASPALDAAIVHARGRLGMGQIRADRSAPRTIIRYLAQGKLVGILPDQQPRAGEGVFAPFFGLHALTMTLAPRLAQRAPTLIGWAERLPDAGGYILHLQRAPAALADPDPVIATAAMNAAIEATARQAPAQYAWTYKRFSKVPPGEPKRYGPETRRRR
jgi:KDO2-lipid IV(A) lauroyltransferase